MWYFGHQVLASETYVHMYKVGLSVVCLTVTLVCRTVHVLFGPGGYQFVLSGCQLHEDYILHVFWICYSEL